MSGDFVLAIDCCSVKGVLQLTALGGVQMERIALGAL